MRERQQRAKEEVKYVCLYIFVQVIFTQTGFNSD